MQKLILKASFFSLLISLFACGPATAQGIYVTGPEKGPPDCGHWLSKQEGEVRRDFYKSWLMGYLSGVAVGSGKNILEGTSPESTFFWMDKYCRENPLNGTVQGAMTLVNELQKQKGIK